MVATCPNSPLKGRHSTVMRSQHIIQAVIRASAILNNKLKSNRDVCFLSIRSQKKGSIRSRHPALWENQELEDSAKFPKA